MFPRTLVAAFLTALVLRLGLALAAPVEPTWDGKIYERAATQLAHGEGYTHRMIRPDGPAHATSFFPVGWPAVLGAWRAMGMPRGLDPLLQAILGALAVPLAAALARRRAGPRAGMVCAWTLALWPSGILAASSWMGEPLFTLALLAAMAPLVASSLPRSSLRSLARAGSTRARFAPRSLRPRISIVLASGVLFGLAAWVRPTALAIAPLALAAYGYGCAQRLRIPIALGSALLGTAIALGVLAPWLLRNEAELGRPVLASNAGANLLVGTYSPTFERIPDAIDCPPSYELPRDACRRDRALERITADPLAWAALAPSKLVHTFGYEASSALHFGRSIGLARPERHPLVWTLGAFATLYWLALAALALVAAARAETRERLLFSAPIFGLAIVHAVFLGGDRYHEPLVPLIAVLAAPVLISIPVASLLDRRSGLRAPSG